MYNYPPDFLYQMSCDVFYAQYTSPNSTAPETIAITQDEFGMSQPVTTGGVGQNEFGEAEKVWQRDRTELESYFNVMGTVNLQDLKADTAFEYKKRLNGRFRFPSDPRVDFENNSHPISSILVTNIIDKNSGQQLHLDENSNPIIFDVMSVDPFINPFGKIEYYKILLERADDQFMQLNGVIKKKAGGLRVTVRS
jgi:hypothetical protein